MSQLRRASQLMQWGFSLLGQHRYADAQKVGQKLKRLRHSAAFEILALAYLHSDKLSKAIAILEEGVTKAGPVWVLWELLGNCYSDARRFAKAENAYAEALAREGCDRDVIHLNRAIAFNRKQMYAKAQLPLRLVKSPRLYRRAEACRVRNSLKLGEARVAHRLALSLCGCRTTAAENYDMESKSEILLACAQALKDSPRTKDKALRLAFKALQLRPNNDEPLKVIRDIQGRNATSRHIFRI